MRLKQSHFAATTGNSSSSDSDSSSSSSSGQSSSMLGTSEPLTNSPLLPTMESGFEQGAPPPPAAPVRNSFPYYMSETMGRAGSSSATGANMYRMSSFRPTLTNRLSSLEAATTTATGSLHNMPMYESIDIPNLSQQLVTYNEVAPADYCSGGGSSSEGQSACLSDPTITIPDNHRLYPSSEMEMFRARTSGSSGYLSRNTHYYPHPSDSSVYYPPYGQHLKEEDFDIFNAIFALISLTSYACCGVSSLVLGYFYLHHESDHLMFTLTLAFVLVPSILVNLLSLKWLLADHHKRNAIKKPPIGAFGWMVRILLHLFLMGPILRYVELLRFGVKSWTERRKVDQEKDQWNSCTVNTLSTTLPRPRFVSAEGLPNFEPPTKQSTRPAKAVIDYYLLTVYEDRDTSLLSLFQSLLQGTVQLVLQVYSLLAHRHFEHVHHLSGYKHHFTEYIQLTVISLSLFEIGWSLASYHRALRRASYSKRNLSPLGVILQLIWQSAIVACRTLAIGLFLHQFTFWICPVAIGHWGVMSIWIMHQGTHFFDDHQGKPRLCPEYLFNMLLGAIYLFVFINVKDEPTRWKYVAFYTITIAENAIFTALWFITIDADFHFRLAILLIVVSLFLFGLLVMQIYYWLFHPNGRPLLVNKAARCC